MGVGDHFFLALKFYSTCKISWVIIWYFNVKRSPGYCNMKFAQNTDPVLCRPDFELQLLLCVSTTLHEICQKLQRTQASVQVRWFYWINHIYNGTFWPVLLDFSSVKYRVFCSWFYTGITSQNYFFCRKL